jgi:hypothetical protein
MPFVKYSNVEDIKVVDLEGTTKNKEENNKVDDKKEDKKEDKKDK